MFTNLKVVWNIVVEGLVFQLELKKVLESGKVSLITVFNVLIIKYLQIVWEIPKIVLIL